VSQTRPGRTRRPPHADVAPSGISPTDVMRQRPWPSRRRAAGTLRPLSFRGPPSPSAVPTSASCTAPGRGWGGARCEATPSGTVRAGTEPAEHVCAGQAMFRRGPSALSLRSSACCFCRDCFPPPLRAFA
jgi:hypothetical protein